MEKIVGLVFAVALVTGITGIVSAQQRAFNQSCSAVSFSMANANGLVRAAQVLQIPCQNASVQ